MPMKEGHPPHLGEAKRYELDRIVETILGTIAEVRGIHAPGTTTDTGRPPIPAKDLQDPDFIILYGSHATGEWVDDEYIDKGVTYSYRSDFDILVITQTPKGARMLSIWDRVEDRIARLSRGPGNGESDSDETGEAGTSGGGQDGENIYTRGATPVRIIAHTIKFVNDKLAEGQYFFSDIHKEGYFLWQSGRVALNEPGQLEGAERKAKAQKDYNFWMKSADSFFDNCEYKAGKDDYRNAAFQLHQSAEHMFAAISLAFTGYKPKTHDLKELNRIAGNLNGKLFAAFPNVDEEDKRRFDLLRDAYVRARYDEDYVITADELTYLAERVQKLTSLAEEGVVQHVGRARLTGATAHKKCNPRDTTRETQTCPTTTYLQTMTASAHGWSRFAMASP